MPVWSAYYLILWISLHYSGADTEISDNSDVSPFMLAVKKGHSEVVKAMMKEKPELVSSQLGSGSTVIHWALEECQCSAFFKVFYHLVVSIILGTHREYKWLQICVYRYSSKTWLHVKQWIVYIVSNLGFPFRILSHRFFSRAKRQNS